MKENKNLLFCLFWQAEGILNSLSLHHKWRFTGGVPPSARDRHQEEEHLQEGPVSWGGTRRALPYAAAAGLKGFSYPALRDWRVVSPLHLMRTQTHSMVICEEEMSV